MSYSNIKRTLAAALLVAFTAPSTLAISDSYDSVPYKSSMLLTGDVKLTENNDTITLSLRDSDVKQVLRMFADKAGMNIVFHNSVTGKVTLDLVNMQINEAFNLVLQISGMNYYQQGNTMIVMSKSSPDNASYSKQEMMVFPVKYVSAAKIADFLNKNVFGMKKAGLSSVDAATVNSATNELIVFGMPSDVAIIQKVIEQFDKEPFSKTFAVNHTTPAEMANMICNMLLPSRGIVSGGSDAGGVAPSAPVSSEEGEMTGGAASIAGSSGGGGTALKLGEGIVACSISATTAGNVVAPFDVQNLSIAYFPQRGTITLMGGSEAQAAMIENFIKTNDVKQPQAFLEVSIVELNEQGSKEFQNNWQVSSKAWGASFLGGSFSGGRPGGPYGNWMPATDYVWNSKDNTGDPYTDKDGNNGNYESCNTVVQLFNGTKDVTNKATYNVVESEGLTGTWDAENYKYSVTDLATDTGYADIQATYHSLTVTKRFSVSKAKAGEALQGKSTYEIWKELGYEGDASDFIEYLKGQSAYEYAKEHGYDGSEEEFGSKLATPTPTKLSELENDLYGSENKIPSEFLDVEAPQSDWNQSDSSQKDYIKNRTHYDDTESGGQLKQLDEKFIPDAIARVNYVDNKFATKEEVSNIDLSGYETTENANAKLTEAKSYTDTAVANLVDSAPETMNTIGELATAMKENQDVVEALDNAITNKSQVQFIIWGADD